MTTLGCVGILGAGSKGKIAKVLMIIFESVCYVNRDPPAGSVLTFAAASFL